MPISTGEALPPGRPPVRPTAPIKSISQVQSQLPRLNVPPAQALSLSPLHKKKAAASAAGQVGKSATKPVKAQEAAPRLTAAQRMAAGKEARRSLAPPAEESWADDLQELNNARMDQVEAALLPVSTGIVAPAPATATSVQLSSPGESVEKRAKYGEGDKAVAHMFVHAARGGGRTGRAEMPMPFTAPPPASTLSQTLPEMRQETQATRAISLPPVPAKDLHKVRVILPPT